MITKEEALILSSNLEVTTQDMINVVQYYIYIRKNKVVDIMSPEHIVQNQTNLPYEVIPRLIFQSLYTKEVVKLKNLYIIASSWIIENEKI